HTPNGSASALERPERIISYFRGVPYPSDPERPSVELKTAWETIRTKAKVECRFHDLRHTLCTKMAEAGVPESTMLAIMGHMSRAMLERYSHIRMAAKREAMNAIRAPKLKNSTEVVQESVQVQPFGRVQRVVNY